MNKSLSIAAFLLALGVVMGAFGAHGLKGRVEEHYFAVYETAVLYHLIHAIGLIIISTLPQINSALANPARWSFYLLLAGIFVFSGSLYLLVLTGARWLGAVTPIGGLCFVIGWLVLAVAAFRVPVEGVSKNGSFLSHPASVARSNAE